jgi:alkanesulfonate monooxygenase SsuD/methylene tetrahydromethanopterin reductase-like flavin-dependent oxidoreductase (luciferase family)
MRLGLALPQYDYSVAGERPLQFRTVLEYAQAARRAGATSLWLSDHLFLDLAKYGGPADREFCFDPLVTLAALARQVPDVRLGTLVMCEALRPPAVLAKALASLDRVSDGRVDAGIGAGWYEPEYDAIGMTMPSPGARLTRLAHAVDVVKEVLAATDDRDRPPPVQQPRPRVFVGGKGDRLLQLVAEHADGWNTCWVWTPDAYRERLEVLARACEKAGRDPATVWRTVGLYALCGEDERDLQRRFDRLKENSTTGVVDGVDLEEFRKGRLVGTVDEVREQLGEWDALGVETIVLGVGAVPFQVSTVDDVDLLLSLAAPA